MSRILQQPESDDCVVAIGEMHSVPEFVELAFAEVGRRIAWSAQGVDEAGFSDEIVFDIDKQDAPPRKLMATSKLEAMGWQPHISLEEGIAQTYQSLLKSNAMRAQAYASNQKM